MDNKITKWSVLEPLLQQDNLHLREISRILKKPHASLRKHLSSFEKEGIVRKEIKGRMTFYRINYSNSLIIDYLTIVEKERLVYKCKREPLINELVSFLHQYLKEENRALIFGSSVNDFKKANDIDLIITGKIDFEKKLIDFEKKFNLKVHLINVKDLNEIKEGLKIEVKKKHLIIQGSEEVIKWLV
ncbi:MAG: helix-turn-helix domain-containing protein [Nanoarchaeota archaeon]|nr:helix-turn-helix domain-containing protein [Nanoarchaeota archaeon]